MLIQRKFVHVLLNIDEQVPCCFSIYRVLSMTSSDLGLFL